MEVSRKEIEIKTTDLQKYLSEVRCLNNLVAPGRLSSGTDVK